MQELNGRLVGFLTRDSLKLKGYLASARANDATIIHIHGNCGNFYENDFIATMAEAYTRAGINFLTVNNRGHDGIAEAYQSGNLVYIGASYESLDECLLDIDGAVRFANSLGAPVILQGHSFGCLKVLIYLIHERQNLDFILLSPSDIYQLQCDYISPESIDAQISRISGEYRERQYELLPTSEFGIKHNGLEYYIPVSARTFLSYFRSHWLGLLRFRGLMAYHLETRGLVYCGGRDALRTESPDTVRNFFECRVRELRFLYLEEGDHHFHGFEESVARAIAAWVHGAGT